MYEMRPLSVAEWAALHRRESPMLNAMTYYHAGELVAVLHHLEISLVTRPPGSLDDHDRSVLEPVAVELERMLVRILALPGFREPEAAEGAG